MSNKLAILSGLLFIFSSQAQAAIAPIADGGTNSGTALNNNKMIYSSSGKIVENADIVSTGSNLKIGETGVSTSTNTPSKFILQGTASSQANGPHMQAYVSTDAYPVSQFLNYGHDNQGLSFDAYWDDGASSWKSSDSGSNFQFYKINDTFRLRYGTGVAAGSNVTMNDVMVVDTSGNTTFGGSIYLPTSASGASASPLNYYEEYTYSTSTSSGCAGGGVSSVNVDIKFVRIGKMVTVKIPAVANVTISGAGDCIGLGIPARFAPSNADSHLVQTQNGTGVHYLGLVSVSSTGFIFTRDYGLISFSAGNNRGWKNAVSLSYSVD